MSLQFGYNHGLPATRPDVAWGARLIVTQDGHVDLVPDRVSSYGGELERNAFFAVIDQRFPIPAMIAFISENLRLGLINTRRSDEFRLYEDADICVKGNAMNSGGYFYVAAYAKHHDWLTQPLDERSVDLDPGARGAGWRNRSHPDPAHHHDRDDVVIEGEIVE